MSGLTFLDPALASAGVGLAVPRIIGFAGALPTIRNTALYSHGYGSSHTVALPAGATPGDLAVVTTNGGWFVNQLPGWTLIINDEGVGWQHRGCQYKVLDAADVAAGTLTLTFGGSYPGCIGITLFEEGARCSIRIAASQQLSGVTAPAPSRLLRHAEVGELILVHAGARGNGAVSVAGYTALRNVAASDASAALATATPTSDGFDVAAITYASSGGGVATLILGITLDAGVGVDTPPTVATATGTGAIAANRIMTGNSYFEMTLAAKVINPGVGVVAAAYVFNANQIGTTNQGVAYNADGAVRLNNALVATLPAYEVGDTVRVAFDPGNKRVWFAVNGGAWNNNGAADPAAGIGGLALPALAAGGYRAALNFPTTGSGMAMRFAADEFIYAPPTGFFTMDIVPEPLVRVYGLGFSPNGAQAAPLVAKAMIYGPANKDKPRTLSFPAGPVSVVAGSVLENGAPSPNRRVLLYSRNTGDLIGEAFTNAAGDYVLPAADAQKEHFVIAFGDPDYNAKIYDGVKPG